MSSNDVCVSPSSAYFAGFPTVKDACGEVVGDLSRKSAIDSVLIDVIISEIYEPLFGKVRPNIMLCEFEWEL
jgi:hypothetical protein